jgi:hypothetical protein
MIPWGKWVISFGPVFCLDDWERYSDFATVETV